MAQNDKSISVSGTVIAPINLVEKGEKIQWSPTTALADTKVTVIGEGQTIQVDANPRALTTGRQYIKNFASMEFRQIGNTLLFIQNGTESDNITATTSSSPVSTETDYDVDYNIYSVTFNLSGAYDTTLNKSVILHGGYNINASGVAIYGAGLDVKVGSSVPVAPNAPLNGILTTGQDTFGVTVRRNQACTFVLYVMLSDGIVNADDDIVYGIGTWYKNSVGLLGNITPRTLQDVADSDFYFQGIDIKTSTDFVGLGLFQSINTATAPFPRSYVASGIFESDYFGSNQTAEESHPYSYAFMYTPFRPKIGTDLADETYLFKLTLATGQTLGDINGQQDSVFECRTSTASTGLFSITLGQFKENVIQTTPTPTTLPMIDFSRMPAFATINFKNSKETPSLYLYRDYQGSSTNNIRFNFISSTYSTSQEIADLDNSVIDSIVIGFLQPSTTAPITPPDSLTDIGVTRFTFNITKSTVGTTPPSISPLMLLDRRGQQITPSIVSVEPSTTYDTDETVVYDVRLDGLFGGAVVFIADTTGYVSNTRKDAYFGRVNLDGQTNIFTAIGGGADVRKMILPNVDGVYEISILVYTRQATLGGDVSVAFSDNNTPNQLVLGGLPDSSTSDLLFGAYPSITLPAGLPITTTSLQQETGSKITFYDSGGGNNSQAQNGWGNTSRNEFYTSIYQTTPTTVRTNVNTLLWYNDTPTNGRTYNTFSPANPSADPTGFFSISQYDTQTRSFVVTANTTIQGFWNTNLIIPIVLSSGRYNIQAKQDLSASTPQDNKVIIRFYSTSGADFDISDISGFGFVTINVSTPTITTTSLFSATRTTCSLSIVADQVNSPIITQTSNGPGDGISLELDTTFTPTIFFPDNIVADNETQYLTRFKVTGSKLNQNSILAVLKSESYEIDAVTGLYRSLSYRYSPIPIEYTYVTTPTTTSPLYILLLLPNITSQCVIIVDKIKENQDFLASETRGALINAIGERQTTPAKSFSVGDYTFNGTGEVTGILNRPNFANAVTVCQGLTTGNRTRRWETDIYTSDANLGYPQFSTTIFRNPRVNSAGNVMDDVGMSYISVSQSELDVFVQSDRYVNTRGKKVQTVISTTGGGKRIFVNDLAGAVIPFASLYLPQAILRPIASITGSQFLVSQLNASAATVGGEVVEISCDQTNAVDIAQGYVIFSTLPSPTEILNRMSAVNKQGKSSYSRIQAVQTVSPDGTTPPTLVPSILRPTATADRIFELNPTTPVTFLGCVENNADSTQSVVTDLTTDPTKYYVYRLNCVIATGWDTLPNPILVSLLNNNIFNDPAGESAPMWMGTCNCVALNIPNISELPEINIIVKAVDQTIVFDVRLLTLGAYTNPDNNALVAPSINSLCSYNGIGDNLVNGWAEGGTGGVLYTATNSSMSYTSMDNSFMVDSVTREAVTGGKYISPIINATNREINLPLIPPLKKGGKSVGDLIITEEGYRILSNAISHKGLVNVTRYRYTRKDVLERIEVLKQHIKDCKSMIAEVHDELSVSRLFAHAKAKSISPSFEYKRLLDDFLIYTASMKDRLEDLQAFEKTASVQLKRYEEIQSLMNGKEVIDISETERATNGIVADYLKDYYTRKNAKAKKDTLPITNAFKNANLKYSIKRDLYRGVNPFSEEWKHSYKRYTDPFINTIEERVKSMTFGEGRKYDRVWQGVYSALHFLVYRITQITKISVYEYASIIEWMPEEQRRLAISKEDESELQYILMIIADKLIKEDSLLARDVKSVLESKTPYVGDGFIQMAFINWAICPNNKKVKHCLKDDKLLWDLVMDHIFNKSLINDEVLIGIRNLSNDNPNRINSEEMKHAIYNVCEAIKIEEMDRRKNEQCCIEIRNIDEILEEVLTADKEKRKLPEFNMTEIKARSMQLYKASRYFVADMYVRNNKIVKDGFKKILDSLREKAKEICKEQNLEY